MSIYTPPNDNNPSGNSDLSSSMDIMMHPTDKPVPGQQEHHKWPRSHTAASLPDNGLIDLAKNSWSSRSPLVETWNSD